MHGVGVADWLLILFLCLAFTDALQGRCQEVESSIGLRNAAICTMLFVYDQFFLDHNGVSGKASTCGSFRAVTKSCFYGRYP